MLRSILYVFMAGTLAGSFGWMRQRTLEEVGETGPGTTAPTIEARTTDPQALKAETKQLLAWVDHYDLGDESFSAARFAAPASSAIGSGSVSSASRLEVNIDRDTVRERLGEPAGMEGGQDRWIYDDVTVLFDGDRVIGWFEADGDAATMLALRNAMAPIGDPDGAKAPTDAAPRFATPAPASPRRRGGGVRYGYRRPLDRIFDRARSGNRNSLGSYRKPAYLRNMFDSPSRRTPIRSRYSSNSRNRY